ncbi:hypothetical protein Tco_0951261 [Tanacetum coccineum]|uniref:Uncharacterized protein n=1 Tax=Tanacetum coccineum TaxID=301880 RepID=A0ABQ5DTK5_9ASTR
MITNVIKPKRWTSKGYRISPNKSSDVHEKPNTPRSCLRWKPTSRIFNIAGLRWIPTGKMFTDSTTKVDSEPPNGSNDDITNPYECDQTHHVIAGTLNSSAGSEVRANPVYSNTLCSPYRKRTMNIPVSTIVLMIQNQRDLPRDNPLVSVEVFRYDIKRSKSENNGIVPTEMELVLEQTQRGTSHEVLDYIKMEMHIPHSSRVKFIATCSYSRLNDFLTSRKNDPKLSQTLISTSSSVCQSDEVMN